MKIEISLEFAQGELHSWDILTVSRVGSQLSIDRFGDNENYWNGLMTRWRIPVICRMIKIHKRGVMIGCILA